MQVPSNLSSLNNSCIKTKNCLYVHATNHQVLKVVCLKKNNFSELVNSLQTESPHNSISSSSSLLTTWVQTNISFIMYTESHVMTIKNIN